jgi:hypothetical protein
MAINRHTKPIDYSIQKTQVLPRTEILLGSLAKRQTTYDEEVERLQTAIGTVSGYEVVGDAAKNDLKVIENILNEGSTNLLKEDLSDPSVQGKVNKLIGEIANNSKLKTHLSAKQSYDKFIEQYEDLSKRGKLHDNNLHFMKKAWSHYKKTGEFDSDSLSNPIIPEAVDVITERGRLVNMIKASGGDAIKYLESGIAYKNSSSGVDVNKIRQAVDEQLLTYSQSAAGRQELTDYRVLVDKGVINPEKTDFTTYLRQQVMSTAKNYAYSQSSTNMDGALNANRKKKQEAEPAGEGYMPAIGGKDIELDSDGRININPFLDLWDAMTGGESRTEEQLELEKTLQAGAKKSGTDIKTYVDRLNADPNIRVSYYNSKQSKEMSTRLYDAKTGGGQLSTKVIYSKDYPEGISMQEYLAEEGMTELEVKNGFTVVGEVFPDNPYTPKGQYVTIGGKPIIIDDIHALKPAENKEHAQIMYENAKAQAKYNGRGNHKAVLGGVEFGFEYDASTGTVKEVSRKILENKK